jgi:hypothetical protein
MYQHKQHLSQAHTKLHYHTATLKRRSDGIKNPFLFFALVLLAFTKTKEK